MNRKPHLCMVFEGIGPYNAIGRIAMAEVRLALGAGWRVSVVAKRLDESLRGEVEWLKLYVPPKLHYVQWVTAGRFIRHAMAGRRFDLVHAHQPQAASLSDVFQCHFLTRVAHERRCLESRASLRAKFVRLQQRGVLRAEDRCYRRWNPATWMVFGGEMMQREFARLYGPPPRQAVICQPVPEWDPAGDAERAAARRELVGGFDGLVIGYLGGVQERKGYRRLIDAVERDERLFLLMGGIYSDRFEAPRLGGRFRALGLTAETAKFYAACDVFAVPSLFEPTGMVAFEAAARGTPVLATAEVGALAELEQYGAGERWSPAEPIGPVARRMAEARAAYRRGGERLCAELSVARFGERMMRLYEDVLDEKAEAGGAPIGAAVSAGWGRC